MTLDEVIMEGGGDTISRFWLHSGGPHRLDIWFYIGVGGGG